MSIDGRVVTFHVRVEPGRSVLVDSTSSEADLWIDSFVSKPVALADFPLGGVRLDVLVSGSTVVSVPPIFDRDLSLGLTCRFEWRLPEGLLIRGGEQVGLRFEGPSPLIIEVGARTRPANT